MPDPYRPCILSQSQKPRIVGALGGPLKITRSWENRSQFIHAICIGENVVFIRHSRDIRPRDLSQVETLENIPYCLIRLSLDERIEITAGSDSVNIRIKKQ
jgi:hypothetical protein